MKIASITGELKPKSEYEYDYQIKFDVLKLTDGS